MNAATTYVGATFSASFFLEVLARFLRNILAQLEPTEALETRTRPLASDYTCGEEQAREQLRDGEELYRDELGNWYGKSLRPRFELDNTTRSARDRLTFARAVLEQIIDQAVASRDWQAAIAIQNEHDRVRNDTQQLLADTRLFEHSPSAPPAPRVRLMEISCVVHIAELRAVLDLLAALNVDPHKER